MSQKTQKIKRKAEDENEDRDTKKVWIHVPHI